ASSSGCPVAGCAPSGPACVRPGAGHRRAPLHLLHVGGLRSGIRATIVRVAGRGYPGADRDRRRCLMTTDPTLSASDQEVAELITAEGDRQREMVRLIASENYVSAAVLEATGTGLTNK